MPTNIIPQDDNSIKIVIQENTPNKINLTANTALFSLPLGLNQLGNLTPVEDDLIQYDGSSWVTVSVSGVAQQLNLDNKVDVIPGKGLSTEDFTTAEKNKLASLDFTWVEISSSITAEVNTGYIVNSFSLLNILLPSVCFVGDKIAVYANSTSFWRLNQNANQQIQVGNSLTTLGVTGQITGEEMGCGINLVCIEDNNKWVSTKVFGNINIL